MTRTTLLDPDRTRIGAMLALFMLLLSGSATAWWQADWPYRKSITVDGAAVAVDGELDNVPVLIRLHEGVFHFPDARPDGADLRFVAADDKTPLNFHVETFDPVFNMAQIWLQVPKISAGKPVQVWMYYGNEKATPPAEAPALTYDGTHLLVYHFGERDTPPQDTTLNKLHALSRVAVADGGMAGALATFDGTARVQLPASPLLSFLPTQALTLSFWVKPATESATGVIYAQRDPAGGEFTVGLNAGVPYVGVVDTGGVLLTSSPAPALAGGKWYRVAVVADTTHLRVFVDGKEAATLERTLPAVAGAATIGATTAADGSLARAFSGQIDEFSIANVARSPAWLALEAANQGATDKLVVFGDDEQQSSMSTGYFGVILASVTIDGWVAIAVLILMMFYSWWIMYAKGMQIAAVGRANTVFLTAFRAGGGDLARLHHALAAQSAELGLDAANRKTLIASPLLRIFNEGISELHNRIGSEERRRSAVALSPQSIEAIRASLNATLMREQQALSARMVLLTIAISGGPFIGLFGTVVGVMITFAAVAASGDVNVNAIAPGISAALAATVAGLFVAIPALFGYNYLITRVKECTVDMQVFVDMFVTRIAENYNDGAALHAIADE